MAEFAVHIPAQSLVGVLKEAESPDDNRRPAIVFLNAGLLHRIGPNRLYVRLARELARRGFTSLRFDRSGVGDSLPRRDGLPLSNAALADVRDAIDYIATEQGSSSFILIGICSGADLAFRSALVDPRVVGAILIDGLPYETLRSRSHRYLSRLMRKGGFQRLFAADGPILKRLRRSKATQLGAMSIFLQREVPSKQEAETGLCELVKRGVRLLLVYTSGREYSYSGQFSDMFPTVSLDHVDVDYLQEVDHTFTLCASQELLVCSVLTWISKFSKET